MAVKRPPFPETGLVRLAQILTILPIPPLNFFERRQFREISTTDQKPRARMTCWSAHDILKLIDEFDLGGSVPRDPNSVWTRKRRAAAVAKSASAGA